MLGNERFTAKAPAHKVDEERAKQARFELEVRELEARLSA
jgi:valyl-tRNA synthetase